MFASNVLYTGNVKYKHPQDLKGVLVVWSKEEADKVYVHAVIAVQGKV